MITHVAMFIDEEIQSLPKPNHHHHIIHKFPKPQYEHGKQGFIDSELGFVNRKLAKVLAIGQDQFKPTGKYYYSDKLFSEDLW